ncbi:uncharacterized protein [Amphiura filiformis]|uniref:uncharacterized protein n=1 Tax=Amphiura filiformis TaxID=82378 RepID=UPI003B221965
MEGESMILNCSSESGKPTVSIDWTQTGSTEELLQTRVIKENSVYSEFSFQAKLSHKDAMFVCEIRSKHYPSISDHKCHVGPMNVIRNPDTPWPMTTKASPVRVTEPKYTLLTNNTVVDDDECHEICADMTAESVFRWTIATVIAGLLALVFFVFGIVLLIRYCFALDEQRVPPEEDLPDMPDMSNVQYRIDGNRLYMTLERPSTSQTEVVYQGGEVLERQYILAPSRAGEFDQFDGSYIGGTPSLRDSEPPYLRTPIRRDSYTQSTDSPVRCIELDKESVDNTTMSEDIDRPSYQGTPIHNACGGSTSLQGTPTHRLLMDQVLMEAQSEGYIGTPPRRESEGYIGAAAASSRGDSDRFLYGSPTRGDYDRQRCLTPTLPPRRYKTHYV